MKKSIACILLMIVLGLNIQRGQLLPIRDDLRPASSVLRPLASKEKPSDEELLFELQKCLSVSKISQDEGYFSKTINALKQRGWKVRFVVFNTAAKGLPVLNNQREVANLIGAHVGMVPYAFGIEDGIEVKHVFVDEDEYAKIFPLPSELQRLGAHPKFIDELYKTLKTSVRYSLENIIQHALPEADMAVYLWKPILSPEGKFNGIRIVAIDPGSGFKDREGQDVRIEDALGVGARKGPGGDRGEGLKRSMEYASLFRIATNDELAIYFHECGSLSFPHEEQVFQYQDPRLHINGVILDAWFYISWSHVPAAADSVMEGEKNELVWREAERLSRLSAAAIPYEPLDIKTILSYI